MSTILLQLRSGDFTTSPLQRRTDLEGTFSSQDIAAGIGNGSVLPQE